MAKLITTLVLGVIIIAFCYALGVGQIFDAVGDWSEGRQASAATGRRAAATRTAYDLRREEMDLELRAAEQVVRLDAIKQRATAQAQRHEHDTTVTAYTSTLTGNGWRWLALASGVGLVVLLLATGWNYRHRHIKPDERGQFPATSQQLTGVSIGEIISGNIRASERARELEVERAAAEALAAPEHYAPSYTYAPKFHNRQDIQGGEVVTPQPAPSFRRLLEAGKIGEGQPLLLGIGAEQAVQGGWGDIISAAVAGATGSGKTTTTRFLAAQGALQGAQFAIIDPHAGAGADSLVGTLAPLAQSFRWQPAETPSEILDLIALIEAEIDRRAHGRLKGRPLIVGVDELTALLKRKDLEEPLGYLLERIAQEGRKLGVYGLFCGQIWSASRAGGSELRDSLASAYVHRIKRAQARFLLPPEEAQLAERLATGAALLYRTSGEIVPITIPNTTAADMQQVGAMLSKVGATTPLRRHFYGTTSRPSEAAPEVEVEGPRSAPEVEVEVPTTGREVQIEPPQTLEPALSLSEERERAQVQGLLVEGASQTKIIREVWGATGGAAWYAAKEKLDQHRAALGL